MPLAKSSKPDVAFGVRRWFLYSLSRPWGRPVRLAILPWVTPWYENVDHDAKVTLAASIENVWTRTDALDYPPYLGGIHSHARSRSLGRRRR